MLFRVRSDYCNVIFHMSHTILKNIVVCKLVSPVFTINLVLIEMRMSFVIVKPSSRTKKSRTLSAQTLLLVKNMTLQSKTS